MMWFETLTGFAEESPQRVRRNITLDGRALVSHVNGKALVHGQLETPTLAELRERVHASGHGSHRISVREVVANVQHLHTDVSNAGALFQVASQFNLLELASPNVTPERGVGVCEHDHTQGPACHRCWVGTIYRNHLLQSMGQIGASTDNQIDCLADIGAAWGNSGSRLWAMTNGYAMASQSGLTDATVCKPRNESELTD